ncbi:M20/M25/M40 family metallo-hydrolase [Nocardia sp. NPDC056100]|uniref:M20/M25/M40 family metallo-hydrolase n=1 Tax=Nocardia sp. NPDC056100 TaxID=3345712 RepID=UPI0035D9AE7D
MVDENRLLEDLTGFVAVPSVSADPSREQDVQRSAQLVAQAFGSVGVQARVVTRPGGLPAVIGRREGPPGAPTVLLYAHHDVQPVGDRQAWQSDPFTLTRREGRLYGRGTADDKGAIAVHLETLRCLGPDLPVTVTVLIEGEEEIGSPTLQSLLLEQADTLRADVVIAPDAVNADVGIPSLTVSLRGLLNILITVRTAETPVHSGVFGGAVPDAVTTLCRLLASMTDETGAVSIAGIHPGHCVSTAGPDPADIRTQSTMLPDVEFVGKGSMSQRLWDGPALTVTGIDAPPAAGAANILSPAARAAVSIRLAPEQDPTEALQAVENHIRANAPKGIRVDIEPVAMGSGWRADPESPLTAVAQDVLANAFGNSAVTLGVGGGIPFIAALLETMPEIDVLVTAVQDPYTRAHAPDESVAQSALISATHAQIELLRRLGARYQTTKAAVTQ